MKSLLLVALLAYTSVGHALVTRVSSKDAANLRVRTIYSTTQDDIRFELGTIEGQVQARKTARLECESMLRLEIINFKSYADSVIIKVVDCRTLPSEDKFTYEGKIVYINL